MFDIGFFELLVIGIVGLLVIGPERLPETLRTLALWWGRFKRGVQSTRTEFEQQIGADDIRRQLHNEDVMQRLNATKSDIQRTITENVDDIQSAMQEHKSSFEQSLSDTPSTGDIESEFDEQPEFIAPPERSEQIKHDNQAKHDEQNKIGKQADTEPLPEEPSSTDTRRNTETP